MLLTVLAAEGDGLVGLRPSASVFDESGGVHGSLGEDAQHRLSLAFERSLFERFDGVLAQEAPTEDAMLSLELGDGLVGRPIERAVGERGLSVEETLASETSLRRADEKGGG